jgi:hypothetical protein
LQYGMSVISFSAPRRLGNSLLAGLLAGVLPLTAAAVSTSLSWNPSPDAAVTGYNLYYGGTSHQYTNFVAVGNVTNAVIPGLLDSTTYFFAAKARNSAGLESDFSNEAAFAGLATTPDAVLHLKTVPKTLTGDPLLFSLDATAPAGATINATNGIISWAPGRSYAATTNYLNVIITDTVNPALSLSETILVTVGDYLEFRPGTAAVAAGQNASLPLALAASSSVTNAQFTLAWPDTQLLNPTLTFAAPVIAGSLQHQNHQLVIQLQTAANQPLTGSNLVAQVNFQAAPGQASTVLSLAVSAASGSTANGTSYANVLAQPAEVVVVGSQPLLRPLADTGHGRALTLFANPGATYQLQYATSLAAPVTWTPLQSYAPTNAAQTIVLDNTQPVIFYRLQQL